MAAPSLEAVPPPALAAPRRARRLPARLPSPTVAIAAAVCVAVLAMAILGPALAPMDPRQIHLGDAALGPGGAYPLGTDDLGRDVLSRVLVGARTALIGPLAIALLTVVASAAIGIVAGYRGGWVDALVSRVVDLMYALPALMVAIVVVGVLGGGYLLAIAVLVALNVPQNVRVIRAAALEQRGLPYVEAARVLGAGPWSVMFRQILPNLHAVLAATLFLRFTYSFVDLTTLSFLGLGVDPGTPDWGRMLADSRVLVFENPWTALAPALLIVLTAVSVNVVGDHLHERLAARGRAR